MDPSWTSSPRKIGMDYGDGVVYNPVYPTKPCVRSKATTSTGGPTEGNDSNERSDAADDRYENIATMVGLLEKTLKSSNLDKKDLKEIPGMLDGLFDDFEDHKRKRRDLKLNQIQLNKQYIIDQDGSPSGVLPGSAYPSQENNKLRDDPDNIYKIPYSNSLVQQDLSPDTSRHYLPGSRSFYHRFRPDPLSSHSFGLQDYRSLSPAGRTHNLSAVSSHSSSLPCKTESRILKKIDPLFLSGLVPSSPLSPTSPLPPFPPEDDFNYFGRLENESHSPSSLNSSANIGTNSNLSSHVAGIYDFTGKKLLVNLDTTHDGEYKWEFHGEIFFVRRLVVRGVRNLEVRDKEDSICFMPYGEVTLLSFVEEFVNGSYTGVVYRDCQIAPAEIHHS
jgi:hypothetical protein